MTTKATLIFWAAALMFTMAGCDFKGGIENSGESEQVHELVGTWEGQDGSFTFLEDGQVMLGSSSLPDTAKVMWEVIEVQEPKQIYTTIEAEGQTIRSMLGIYKIVDGKLYFRPPIEYYQTMGGIQIGGPTRVEYPTDFSGNVSVYERVNN